MRVINPDTGQTLRIVEEDSEDTLQERLSASQSAFLAWRGTGFAQRAALFQAAAAELRAQERRFAGLMVEEMGKPIRQARGEVQKCAWVCEYYAEHAEAFLTPEPTQTDASESLVRFDPLGAILAVMPWNFPFWQVFRFAAPTLMAGNVGLLKHAPNVPGCATAIAEVFQAAGFPEGVFQTLMISVERVEGVIADPRVKGVALTGSERAGQAVAAQAGRALKPTVLELGGSDPFIVLADADLDAAVDTAIISRLLNNGQSCIAAKRFIVEDAVHDDFVDRLEAAMAAQVVGDPNDEATDVGPMARADLRSNLHRQVLATIAEGATLRLGGEPLDRTGFYYPPTLLTDLQPGMTAFKEETFGPLAAVARVHSAEEAVALANDTEFGLGASVWTTAARGRRLASQINAGHVAVNGLVKSDPRLPFGGIGRSGYGRELGRWGILEFVNIKTVWVK